MVVVKNSITSSLKIVICLRGNGASKESSKTYTLVPPVHSSKKCTTSLMFYIIIKVNIIQQINNVHLARSRTRAKLNNHRLLKDLSRQI